MRIKMLAAIPAAPGWWKKQGPDCAPAPVAVWVVTESESGLRCIVPGLPGADGALRWNPPDYTDTDGARTCYYDPEGVDDEATL